jgi:hypothetical protein
MTHSLSGALGALAVAGTLTLSAQTPTPSAPRPQTPSPSPSTSSRSHDKTLTLTGCLKAQDADPGRPNSTASGTATASKFVLTNVQGDSMAMVKPGATTPGTKTRTAIALTADAGVDLAAHVNHQVRVTGKHTEMTPADPAATPGDPLKPDSTASPGETPPTGNRTGPDRTSTLAVSSVTMISSSCTAATK